MSQRDIALALGVSRQELASWLDLAAIPEDEFDRLVKSDDFNVTKVKYLARLRANKVTSYERKCPHCGGLLRIEGQATLEALLWMTARRAERAADHEADRAVPGSWRLAGAFVLLRKCGARGDWGAPLRKVPIPGYRHRPALN